MRLKDADALLEYFMINLGWHDADGIEVDDSDKKRAIIKDWIDGVPTIDAVPVVRCRDCKHWCTDSTPCMQDADVHFCAMVDFYSTADWFCAYGKRREE